MRVAQLDEPQRVRDVAGLTDHVQALLALQQQAQAGPDDFVVIREDDVDRGCGIVGIGHASDDSPSSPRSHRRPRRPARAASTRRPVMSPTA